MPSVDSIRRLRIETSETGSAETRARLLTVADSLAQVEKASASLSRQYSVSAQAEAQQRTVFAATAAGIGTVGKAFKDVGETIVAHPVLVAGAAMASSRALGTLSPALMAASVATKALANDNALMAAGAGVAARGLEAGAAGAAAAAASAKTLAESLSPAVLATRLLGTAFGVALPFLGPIALGLTAIKLGAEGVEKAYDDLAKLVQLAERAQRLDVSGPFLKSFSTLGQTLRLQPGEIESTLGTASGAVRDRFSQPNGLTNSLSTLYSGGFTGGAPLAASGMAETAKTTEERIRAAVVAMGELDALGQRFAELDIAEKFFGPTVADRLRTGQTTAAAMLSDLDEASKAEVLSQADVGRALELSRNIESVKKEISDAMAVTFDFSSAAMALESVWLKVLQTTRDVVVAMNEAIKIPPSPGPSENVYSGLLENQKKFAELAEKADAAAAAGFPNASEKAENYRRQLANVNAELAKIGPQFDPVKYPPPPLPPDNSEKPVGFHTGPEMLGPPMPAIGREPKERAGAAPKADTLDSMDTYLKNLDKARDVAKAEYETISLGNQARERALDLAKAQAAAQTDFQKGLRDSATLTSDETTRIIAAADATVQWKDKAKELQDAINFTSDTSKEFAKTFVGDMRAGKSAMEALADAVDKLAAKLTDKALDTALDSLLGTGKSGGGLLGLLGIGSGSKGGFDQGTGSYSDALTGSGGLIDGFASGGFTGHGGRYDPAGIVHKGEYVFDAESTNRLGVDVLESLRRGGPGYAGGGPVSTVLPMMQQGQNAPAPAQPVTLQFSPTVHIGAGNNVTPGEVRAMLAQQAQEFRRTLPSMIKAARGRGAV